MYSAVAAPVVALGLAALDDKSLTEAVDIAGDVGIHAFDIQLDSSLKLRRSLPLGSTDKLSHVKSALAAQGTEIVCVSNVRDVELLLGPHDFHADAICDGAPSSKIAHAQRAAVEAIDTAASLGVRFVRLYLGCPDHLLMFPWHGVMLDWNDNINRLITPVLPILRHAREQQVRICVEPHPRQAIFDLQSYIYANRLLSAEGESLGLCFDPANLSAGGLDPLTYLRALNAPPEFVHVKDVEHWRLASPPRGRGWKRYGPGVPVRFRVIGSGCLDWPRIRDCLLDMKFDGALVIELEDMLIDPLPALAEAKRHCDRLFVAQSQRDQWW